MKPPHHFCIECGAIYAQGSSPKSCYHCGNSFIIDLGYETDYDKEELEREFREWQNSEKIDPKFYWRNYHCPD